MQCIPVRFSRKLLWMKMAPTNHNSKVIACYYLECVEQCGGIQVVYSVVALSIWKHLLISYVLGCPTILRSDYGTENVNLATIQIAFRMDGNDSFKGQKSFMYGPSTSNIVSLALLVVGVLMELWMHTHLYLILWLLVANWKLVVPVSKVQVRMVDWSL